MLVGLNFSDEFSEKAKTETIEKVVNSLGKRIKTFNPTTRNELVGALSTYSPGGRTHIVLTNTHYNIEKLSTNGAFRVADHYISSRGGAIYGLDPERENNTYVYKVPADLRYMTENLEYLARRAAYIREFVPGYFGRTNGDPHTVIVGAKPSYAKLTKNLESLMTCLHDEWWAGVGFFTPTKASDVAHQLGNLSETFDYATILCCDPDLASALDQEGIRYTQVDSLRYKTDQEYEEAARKLRELSRLDQLIVLD